MKGRNSAWLAVLLLLLSLVLGFVTVELIQRRRYADKGRDLKAALSAFETKALLTLDSDGVLIRPASGSEPVLGRFKKVLGTNEGYSRVNTWYVMADEPSSANPVVSDRVVHLEVELVQKRWIILGKPRVIVDWHNTPSRNAILPLLESALREYGIEYSLIDRGY